MRHTQILTSTVNFPVLSSDLSGSMEGLKSVRPSRCLVSSCCSNSTTARDTSNLRAIRNRTAVVQLTGPSLRRPRTLFTICKKFLVAWNKQTNYHNQRKKLIWYCIIIKRQIPIPYTGKNKNETLLYIGMPHHIRPGIEPTYVGLFRTFSTNVFSQLTKCRIYENKTPCCGGRIVKTVDSAKNM